MIATIMIVVVGVIVSIIKIIEFEKRVVITSGITVTFLNNNKNEKDDDGSFVF